LCNSAGAFYGRRGRINARELWEQMNTCSCLNLILACIVYWQAREISHVLSQCDPVANGIDLSLLEHVSPMSCSTANISSIESSSAGAHAQKRSSLAYKITRISLVPSIDEYGYARSECTFKALDFTAIWPV
jgi:hypothetical protein